MVVTLKELKIQPGRIVSAAGSGTEVIVTVRGVPTVKIIPVREPGCEGEKASPAFGIWSSRSDMSDVGGYVRNLRKGRGL